MSNSLSIKYRPKVFEDVCGQTITTKMLKKIVETRNFKNVYLFAGKSGSGKTTCARIFANEINKGIGSPIEIDGASNNGVDNVRNIIESAKQRALAGEYKIFVIDECHAITSQGWQAFLKGIEEPPAYTIFIFCTTEPNKIPATVLNRMQRYNFSAISTADIKKRLTYICEAEHFTNYSETCDLISKICQGCMRDAITLLDQCSDLSTDLSIENTKDILGELSYDQMLMLTGYLCSKDNGNVLTFIDGLSDAGKDLSQFINVYADFILDMLKLGIFKDASVTKLPEYLVNNISVSQESLKTFQSLVDTLLTIKQAIKYDTSVRTTIEAYLLRFMRGLN